MSPILFRLVMILTAACLGSCAFQDDAPLVAANLGSLSALASPPTAQPSRVVVFGDSLSDAGNAYVGSLHVRAPSPPYYFGRFSDGPVWVELFAAHYGLAARARLWGGTNYAVGGARVGEGMESLPNQLRLYLWLDAPSPLDPRTLYVIYGGGNDIRVALKQPDPAPAVARAAFEIRRMVERLAEAGAVQFLVPNVPDRGHTPAARKRGTVAKEEAMTIAFNRALDLALRDLPERYPIHLVRVDFWTAAETAFAAPERWGFANARDPCMVADDDRVCADPGHYVFWDDIHPTLAGHRFLAAAAIAAWDGTGRPLQAVDYPPNAMEAEVLSLLWNSIAEEGR